ncbi:hypothetical protein [Halobacteriovorax sp. HLS]|nr:hypothetical protein [Halobacteriovorax sp. HLS]
MSNFAKEIVDKIEDIKKSASTGKPLSSEELKVLFLASLLEEEGNVSS